MTGIPWPKQLFTPGAWVRSLAVLLLLLVPPGCGLLLDFDPPAANGLECFATVLSAETGPGMPRHEVVIGSREHPDFVERTSTPAGDETAQLREYFVDGAGSSCARATTVEAAVDDWRRWVRQRIDEVATGPASASDFKLFDGPWCEVDGSVRCVSRDSHSPSSACDAALTVEPLPTCPPIPPPTDACLEVECDGMIPCVSVDFPPTLVGATDSRTVRLRNCGGTGARAIALVLDGSIMPQAGVAQRDFVVSRNTCLPDTPPEVMAGEEILTNPLTDALNATCEFDVDFSPLSPREHVANIVFRSTLDPRHTITLKGDATGGGLSYTVPDLPDPRAIPDTLCVDSLTGGCTRERIVEVVNGGPGNVTITDIRLNSGSSGPPEWEILAPAVPLPPGGITLTPSDPPLQIRVRWCDSGPALGDVLIVDSNDPTNPTFEVKLERQAAGTCPAGT